MENKNTYKHTNALIEESSPYLLQHAHNPVNWYPWGEEALQKAKDENKLLIISIGYAACHWCHVMEHESFEDSLVAQVMNEHFIAIKVDREERPDIDDVYMTACQLSSGRGCGWPLNSFALPDGRPVWAGTYFPKKEWTKILEQFHKLQSENPQKLEEAAAQITSGINEMDAIEVVTKSTDYTDSQLNLIGNQFMANIDFVHGGRQGSPKFPMPNNYEFLLKYHHLTGNTRALEAVNTTLTNMSNGGIYDQAGGGFSRYSVDDIWMVPHFEKMLYDNGQLISLLAETYKLTKKELYKSKIDQSLQFIERELMSDEYGFYSSLDADSEGEEGKYYVWDYNELDSIINNKREFEIFSSYYNIKRGGNWEHKNILHHEGDAFKIVEAYNIEAKELKSIIETINAKLMDIRSTRIRPGLDDKILCSWNALMLKGYIDAYNATGDQHYIDIALKNARFIESNMLENDYRINRNYKNGKSTINGFLEDYALLSDAFISLYQATFDESWVNKADKLMSYAHDHFYDSESKMYNYTSDIDPPLVARKRELGDNVIPGSNSMTARVFFKLGTLLYKKQYVERSEQMLQNMLPQILKSKQPNFYSNWCQLYMDFLSSPYEIAILGDDWKKKRTALASNYLGNGLLLGGDSEGDMALLKDKYSEGITRIFVCQNKVCKFPTEEVEKALELMK